MEVINKRSRHPGHCGRMGDSPDRNTHEHQVQLIHPQRRGSSCSSRNPTDVGEGGHRGSSTLTRSGVVEPFLKREKRWLAATNPKLEELESIRTLHPLQDGELEGCEKPNKGGRSDGEDRPEGCLFHITAAPKLTEVCAVQVEKSGLPVHLPLFRTGPSPQTIYKADY